MKSRHKKRRHFAVIGAVIIAIGSILGFLHTGRELPEEAPKVTATLPIRGIALKAAKQLDRSSARKASRVARFLSREAQQVARFGDDPVSAERRLKEFADSLNANDLQDLASTAINTREGGDERFLSAYLLTLTNSAGAEATEAAIINIAGSKIPDLPGDSPLRAMELTIRAQALEGMARYTSDSGAREKVTDLIHKTSDPFLADRAQRVLYVMSHEGAEGLPAQDTQALSKLLAR